MRAELETGREHAAATSPSRNTAFPGPATDDRMAADVLTAALALCLWLAFGSLMLAVVEGLGPHPARRLAVGCLFVLAGLLAMLMRRRVCAWLQSRPWVVVPLAGSLTAAMAVDGLIRSPYVAVSLTSVGIAVVAARARTVWLCVAVLAAGYAFGVFVTRSPAELSRDGTLGGVMGVLVGYPVVALLLMGLRHQFTWFAGNIELSLRVIRHGALTTTPALEQALRREPIALIPGPPRPALTRTERRLVEELAAGHAPKELAFRWGVSINTVRKHISNAKRKTGARTLRELAGMPAHLTWSEHVELEA